MVQRRSVRTPNWSELAYRLVMDTDGAVQVKGEMLRTAAEIREIVHDYQVQPHEAKVPWLAARGVPYGWLRRWREAVFEGGLDRG